MLNNQRKLLLFSEVLAKRTPVFDKLFQTFVITLFSFTRRPLFFFFDGFCKDFFLRRCGFWEDRISFRLEIQWLPSSLWQGNIIRRFVWIATLTSHLFSKMGITKRRMKAKNEIIQRMNVGFSRGASDIVQLMSVIFWVIEKVECLFWWFTHLYCLRLLLLADSARLATSF